MNTQNQNLGKNVFPKTAGGSDMRVYSLLVGNLIRISFFLKYLARIFIFLKKIHIIHTSYNFFLKNIVLMYFPTPKEGKKRI